MKDAKDQGSKISAISMPFDFSRVLSDIGRDRVMQLGHCRKRTSGERTVRFVFKADQISYQWSSDLRTGIKTD